MSTFNPDKKLSLKSFGKETEKFGVLICGHGSRSVAAVEEFSELAIDIKKQLKPIPLEYGYLEFAKPVLKDSLDKLKSQNLKKIIAIPAMLFAAGHTKNDIPSVLNTYSSNTGLEINYGRELGVNNLTIGAAGERIKQVIDANPKVSASETLLVVVGRGSSDPDANSNVAKITRMLVEGFGFGWGETLFSGVTFPLVEPGLRYAVKLGFKRIIVFPYFLFSGVLIDRIKQQASSVSHDHPEIEFLMANYLGNQPLIVDTFMQRIQEVLSGDNSMNCLLCKYRSKLLGFEEEVGLVQQSHHHHVEGIQGEKSDTHGHVHSHFRYPHSDHPLGPVTLSSSKG